MPRTITAEQIDQWAGSLDARAHLPTLVRRLILATARPTQLVIPTAEGIGSPGLDGVVHTDSGVPPYVPAGASLWEFGTSGDPQKKAGEDFLKRTKQVPEAERAVTTFVLVLSRRWAKEDRDAWIKRRERRGWARVIALDAEDLSAWTALCPGVEGWLAERLGLAPHGVVALRDWWAEWSTHTEPAIPTGLLLAGRTTEAQALARDLLGPAQEIEVTTRTEDEAIAFIAATLFGDIRPKDPSPDENVADPAAEAADRSAREAVAERVLIVDGNDAWRAWTTHHDPLVLIPRCESPTIEAALTQGHHVVHVEPARRYDAGLPKLARDDARAAWEQAGLPWNKADDLARDARRSLMSLRRRIGKTGRYRAPSWATGNAAELLAPLLLAGAWNAANAGDEETVLELAAAANSRGLSRQLTAIMQEVDPPLVRRNEVWEFLDPVDAWDALGTFVTSEDLDVFHDRAIDVLTFRDVNLYLSTTERLKAQLKGTLAPVRYSSALQQGVARTLAILGSMGATPLAGGVTAEDRALRVVHALVDKADADRWRDLAPRLPVLAEAAPSAVLDAIEASLRDPDPALMELFDEQSDGFSTSSEHTPLLWALEVLAFSPSYLSRVAVVLGQLAERDPGGRLANRPENSLRDALHPIWPQSAGDSASRLAALDAVRREAPTAAWAVMKAELHHLHGGMVLNHGPRFREWPMPNRAAPSRTEVIAALTGISDRLVEDLTLDDGRWPDAVTVITEMPRDARTTMLQRATEAWGELSNDTQRAFMAGLRQQVDKHTRYRTSAWAIDDDALNELVAFIDAHGTSEDAPGDENLFTHRPDIPGIDLDTDEGQTALEHARDQAVERALPDGIQSLAEGSTTPWQIGAAIARVTTTGDERLLGWLTSDDDHLRQVAHGLARARQNVDTTWLDTAIAVHPELAPDLLLTADIDESILARVRGMGEPQQDRFWSRVNAWHLEDPVRSLVAREYLTHDRPFSAMDLLYREGEAAFDAELGFEVMQRPLGGTTEPVSRLHSPAYVIGGMLDRLEEAGLEDDRLAPLEWFYNPALQPERPPRVFHRKLAADPELFAVLIALTDVPDPDETPPPGLPDVADPERTPLSIETAIDMLRSWQLPLPGSASARSPEPAAVQEWVDATRVQLARRQLSHTAGYAIGKALSGPSFDTDGVWPCLAVRELLEHENDTAIESGLAIGRLNSRGVTMRGAFSGGESERELAERHRTWADQVRAEWPRVGVALDHIADSYERDARREDGSADRRSDL